MSDITNCVPARSSGTRAPQRELRGPVPTSRSTPLTRAALHGGLKAGFRVVALLATGDDGVHAA